MNLCTYFIETVLSSAIVGQNQCVHGLIRMNYSKFKHILAVCWASFQTSNWSSRYLHSLHGLRLHCTCSWQFWDSRERYVNHDNNWMCLVWMSAKTADKPHCNLRVQWGGAHFAAGLAKPLFLQNSEKKLAQHSNVRVRGIVELSAAKHCFEEVTMERTEVFVQHACNNTPGARTYYSYTNDVDIFMEP